MGMNMIDTTQKAFDHMVRMSCFVADDAVIKLPVNATGAVRTRTAVAAALRSLLDNGLIAMTPRTDWPEWYTIPDGDE